MTPPSRIEHVPALDGLRGAAVVAVLFFHAGHLTGGYLGVDLFFTLSGFLITSLLLAELAERGGVALGHFWARRARRLLPALGVLMVGVSIYAALVARPDELTGIRLDGIWTLLYGANWRAIASHASYWAIFTTPSPLQHTWSLAIEEQFYVVWPLVVFVIARRGAIHAGRRVFVVAATGAILGSAWMVMSYTPHDSSRAYFGTDTRIASILFGAAFAAALAAWPNIRRPSVPKQRVVQGVAYIAVLVLAWMWTSLDGQSSALYRGGFLVAALSATAIIAAASVARDSWLNRTLSISPLRALGLLSYGIYLYHWPIYTVLDATRVGTSGFALTTIRITVTLVAATISYVAIEQPIRHSRRVSRPTTELGAAHSGRRIRTPATVGAAGAVVATLIWSTAGGHALINPRDGATEPTGVAVRLAHAHPDSLRLMLTGSSIAALLKEPLRAAIGAAPVVVLNRAAIGCAFPDGATRVKFPNSAPQSAGRQCGETWRADVEAFRPNAVLYIPGRAPRGDIVEVGGKFLTPCTPALDTIYRTSLRNHVEQMMAPGTTVYLATFAYQLGHQDELRWQHTTDCINQAIRDVASRIPGVRLIDIGAHECRDAQHCTLTSRGEAVRPDGLHFHGKGATLFARWVLNQMRLPATGS